MPATQSYSRNTNLYYMCVGLGLSPLVTQLHLAKRRGPAHRISGCLSKDHVTPVPVQHTPLLVSNLLFMAPFNGALLLSWKGYLLPPPAHTVPCTRAFIQSCTL